MSVRLRLWPRLWSWFKSINGINASAHTRRRRGRRRGNLLDRRWFTFEPLEAKQLLAGDIRLTEFGATGSHFVVGYEIAEEGVPEFNISLYRSYDGVTLNGLVGSRQLTDASDLQPGKHTIGLAGEFFDVRADYQLIAIADHRNKVAESSEENNRIGFRGGMFLTPDGVVHVHGTAGADTVFVHEMTQAGKVKVSVNGWTMDFPADAVSEVHARLHGGDDVFKTLGVVTKNLHAFGGVGDDRLTTSEGNDSLLGGEGNDILFAGAGRDLLVGEGGNDTMHGGAGPDSLFGMAGDDKLFGGGGKDILDGDEGDDTLHAGSSEDKARGGAGRDRFVSLSSNEMDDRASEDTVETASASDDLAADSLIFGDLSSGENSVSAMSSASGGYGYGYGIVWLDDYGGDAYEPNEIAVHMFTIRRETWVSSYFYVDFVLTGVAWYGSSNDYTMSGASISVGSSVTGSVYFSSAEYEKKLYVTPRDDAYEEGHSETITITLQDRSAYNLGSPYIDTGLIIDDEEPNGDFDNIENGVALPDTSKNWPGRALLVCGPPAQIRISNLAYPLDRYVLDYEGQFVISRSPDMSNPIADWSTIDEGTYYVTSNTPGIGWVSLNYDSTPSGLWNYIDWTYFNVRRARFSIELRGGVSSLDLPEGNTVNEHVFTIRRNPEDVPVATTVYYTVSGTATSGVDYTALSGSVSFGANELTKEIRVTVTDDTLVEGNETLTITLTPGDCYEVTGGPATATIVDDDGSVEIAAPGGTFAHFDPLDEFSIPLRAHLSPGITATSIEWTVIAGPGAGYFNPATGQNVDFFGTRSGQVTVRVTAHTQIGVLTDEAVLHVIGFDNVSLNGVYGDTVTISAGGNVVIENDGTVTDVRVEPPIDPSEPYYWRSSFTESVNPFSGRIDLTFYRPGVYMVAVTKQGANGAETSYLQVVCDAGATEKYVELWSNDKKYTVEIKPKPTADLVLISSVDDVVIARIRSIFGYTYKPIGSVDDAIREIEAYAALRPGQRFSVLIVDHGAPGEMSIGGGTDTVAGKYLDFRDRTNADRQRFVDACVGRVSELILGGCRVAANDVPDDPNSAEVGREFMQMLADGGQMNVTANSHKCWWLTDGRFGITKGHGFVTAYGPTD